MNNRACTPSKVQGPRSNIKRASEWEIEEIEANDAVITTYALVKIGRKRTTARHTESSFHRHHSWLMTEPMRLLSTPCKLRFQRLHWFLFFFVVTPISPFSDVLVLLTMTYDITLFRFTRTDSHTISSYPSRDWIHSLLPRLSFLLLLCIYYRFTFSFSSFPFSP